MYVQALWDAHQKTIIFYSCLNISQFILLAVTCILYPFSTFMFDINAGYSCVMLLLELRQLCMHGREYLGDAYNYLDIISNTFIIMTAYNLRKNGPELYESLFNKMLLTLGLMLLGLRALTQLRIFTAYRVLIELIK